MLLLPANFGGTLGVCLGASLLTLLEFIEFGVMTLYNFFIQPKKMKRDNAVMPTNNTTSVDDNTVQHNDWIKAQ